MKVAQESGWCHKREFEEGSPNADADILGPAQSGVDCNCCCEPEGARPTRGMLYCTGRPARHYEKRHERPCGGANFGENKGLPAPNLEGFSLLETSPSPRWETVGKHTRSTPA